MDTRPVAQVGQIFIHRHRQGPYGQHGVDEGFAVRWVARYRAGVGKGGMDFGHREHRRQVAELHRVVVMVPYTSGG